MGTIVWLIAALVLACFLLVGVGCSRGGLGGESRPPVVQTADQLSRLDRKQVRELLQQVATQPPPQTTKLGAMCYAPMLSVPRAEYVCPKCGERTLHEDGVANVVERELTACRREFEELKKITGETVVLDESQFCRKCRPDAKQAVLALRLEYDDQKPHVVERVSANDIRLLREFLAGKLIHVESNDAETPLRHHLPRLQTLLGEKPE